jgi:hypothetical protein
MLYLISVLASMYFTIYALVIVCMHRRFITHCLKSKSDFRFKFDFYNSRKQQLCIYKERNDFIKRENYLKVLERYEKCLRVSSSVKGKSLSTSSSEREWAMLDY